MGVRHIEAVSASGPCTEGAPLRGGAVADWFPLRREGRGACAPQESRHHSCSRSGAHGRGIGARTFEGEHMRHVCGGEREHRVWAWVDKQREWWERRAWAYASKTKTSSAPMPKQTKTLIKFKMPM